MFFLAGPCGGRGRRGPRQGHVRLSRQRPADRLVTELGHSASTSQALREAGGGQGPLCSRFPVGCGISPGWVGSPASPASSLLVDFPWSSSQRAVLLLLWSLFHS